MNTQLLNYLGVKLEKREEYSIDYLETMLDDYYRATNLDSATFVYGKGHRKTIEQRQYEKLLEYKNKLKDYAKHIEICGNSRNSYSKTDADATFMRIKRDYMGNDQLLPAYNVQVAVCDEWKSSIPHMGTIQSIQLRMRDMVHIIITFTAKSMVWRNL